MSISTSPEFAARSSTDCFNRAIASIARSLHRATELLPAHSRDDPLKRESFATPIAQPEWRASCNTSFLRDDFVEVQQQVRDHCQRCVLARVERLVAFGFSDGEQLAGRLFVSSETR